MKATAAAPIAIAVDGGGSKTDAVALELDGTVVATARGTTSSPDIIGMRASAEVVDGLIEQLLAQTGPRPIAAANIYLAGLDLPAEVSVFREGIARYAWSDAVLDNDLFALLRAGTSEADAVAVVCGTGINSVGVRSDGAVVRYPSLGAISGDWGGGWHLGEQALWYAARAVDGRGRATDLVERIPPVFGLDDIPALIEALHFKRLPAGELARLSPVVFEAARSGDTVAASLVDRQAEEIVVFACAGLRRLELLDRPVPVVLGGGVIGSRDARLLDGVARSLAERAPFARIELVTAAPILGAALLALESAGAAPEALEAARLQLAGRPAGEPVAAS